MKTAIASLVGRAIFLGIKFLMIPICLRKLPPNEYAVLAIMGSLEAWFLLLDFGLGLVLQNKTSRLLAINKKICFQEILGASLSVFIIAICFLSILALCLSKALIGSLIPSHYQIFLFTSSFWAIGILGLIAGKIFLGLNKGYWIYLLQTVSGLISLFLITNSNLSLPSAIFAIIGLPHLCLFFLWVFILYQSRGKIVWSISWIKESFQAWILTATALGSIGIDAWVTTFTLTTHEVIQYNLFNKLFGIACFAYSAFLQALWPFCTMAWTQKDRLFIQKNLLKWTVKSCIGIAIFTIVILVFTPGLETIFGYFLPQKTTILFGINLMIRSAADFCTMTLHSNGIFTPFLTLLPLQAIISLALQVFLSHFWGMNGIVAGMIISYLPVAWMLPKLFNRELNKI